MDLIKTFKYEVNLAVLLNWKKNRKREKNKNETKASKKKYKFSAFYHIWKVRKFFMNYTRTVQNSITTFQIYCRNVVKLL